MDLEEIWQEYKKMYLTFNLTITRIRLIAKYSAKIFDKFPKSMPCSLKNEYNDIHNTFLNDMKKMLESKDGGNSNKQPNTGVTNKDDISKYISPCMLNGLNETVPLEINYAINLIKMGYTEFEDSDFISVLNAQDLILVFSYLDAFLSDSIRTIFNSKPETLKSANRNITWEQALKHSNMDDLINYLIDIKVTEKSTGGVVTKLEYLIHDLKIITGISDAFFGSLNFFQSVRNSFVHHKGIVDATFMKKCPDQLKDRFYIGKEIKLNQSLIEMVDNIILFVATFVFRSVSMKFLNRTEYDLRPPLLKLDDDVKEDILTN